MRGVARQGESRDPTRPATGWLRRTGRRPGPLWSGQRRGGGLHRHPAESAAHTHTPEHSPLAETHPKTAGRPPRNRTAASSLPRKDGHLSSHMTACSGAAGSCCGSHPPVSAAMIVRGTRPSGSRLCRSGCHDCEGQAPVYRPG